MKNIFLFFLFLASAAACAQKVDTLTTNYQTGELYERFEVNAKDSVKNGFYYRQSKMGKVLAEGRYKNGVRCCVWSFYNYESPRDTAILMETYDFDKKEDLYFNEKYEPIKGLPHFPGTEMEFGRYLYEFLSPATTANETCIKYDGKKIVVSFRLTPTGELTGARIARNDLMDKEIEKDVLNAFAKTGKWVQSKHIADPMYFNLGYSVPVVFKAR